ncbi:MAG: twin arginine-targeting protein translocase TatC [Gammaproteobacteria bacterium RIFOXYA12_FULL_61_12]|nr:MAG: twin arginine-targeting protein translocase TatC [Gammaproteobacteria bacterium RIFOXYD12_FULL_61_37]OGT92538.1 MAG: twin arginine-targeting protein translocase TatC [Gammaproteobacteria bacterium RIFOXYA12_FULL_61_12]
MTDYSDSPDRHQPFIAHLIELRDRMLRMLLGVALMLLALFPFANDLYHLVASPLIALLPQGSQMIATQVASPFLVPFKLALMAAVFLSIPWILYQFWAFVAPGLYQHEKRLAVPLMVSSISLFYGGMAFAYFLVFPLIFGFMVSVTPDGVAMMTDIGAYLDFVMTLFFAFGAAFQVPVATVLLVVMGVTTPEALIEKRPYIIVGAFVVGMLLTPPDVISQTLLAVPMWMLFEAGLFFARLAIEKKDDTAGSAAEPAETSPAPLALAGAASEFKPLTQQEMEAELNAIEKQDEENPEGEEEEIDGHHSEIIPPVDLDEALKQANELRLDGKEEEARELLYDVLQHGDEKQSEVAHNILSQMI